MGTIIGEGITFDRVNRLVFLANARHLRIRVEN